MTEQRSVANAGSGKYNLQENLTAWYAYIEKMLFDASGRAMPGTYEPNVRLYPNDMTEIIEGATSGIVISPSDRFHIHDLWNAYIDTTVRQKWKVEFTAKNTSDKTGVPNVDLGEDIGVNKMFVGQDCSINILDQYRLTVNANQVKAENDVYKIGNLLTTFPSQEAIDKFKDVFTSPKILEANGSDSAKVGNLLNTDVITTGLDGTFNETFTTNFKANIPMQFFSWAAQLRYLPNLFGTHRLEITPSRKNAVFGLNGFNKYTSNFYGSGEKLEWDDSITTGEGEQAVTTEIKCTLKLTCEELAITDWKIDTSRYTMTPEFYASLVNDFAQNPLKIPISVVEVNTLQNNGTIGFQGLNSSIDIKGQSVDSTYITFHENPNHNTICRQPYAHGVYLEASGKRYPLAQTITTYDDYAESGSLANKNDLAFQMYKDTICKNADLIDPVNDMTRDSFYTFESEVIGLDGKAAQRIRKNKPDHKFMLAIPMQADGEFGTGVVGTGQTQKWTLNGDLDNVSASVNEESLLNIAPSIKKINFITVNDAVMLYTSETPENSASCSIITAPTQLQMLIAGSSTQ